MKQLKLLDEVFTKWEQGAKVYYVTPRRNKVLIGAYDATKRQVVSDLFYRDGVKFGVV